jgi:hypothetical protein
LLRSAPLWPEGNCATGRCTIASHHRLTRGQVSASACSACKPPDGWLGLRPSFSDSFTRYDPRCLSGRRHLLFGRQSQKPVRDLLVANLGCGAIAFRKPGFCVPRYPRRCLGGETAPFHLALDGPGTRVHSMAGRCGSCDSIQIRHTSYDGRKRLLGESGPGWTSS